MKSLNQAIIDTLDDQIAIYMKILREHLERLESLEIKTDADLHWISEIKEKLAEIRN